MQSNGSKKKISLKVNVKSKAEERLKQRATFNSPVAKAQPDVKDIVPHLKKLDPMHTPNTKKRIDMDLNSPKPKIEEQNKKPSGFDSLITSVERPVKQATPKDSKESQSSSGSKASESGQSVAGTPEKAKVVRKQKKKQTPSKKKKRGWCQCLSTVDGIEAKEDAFDSVIVKLGEENYVGPDYNEMFYSEEDILREESGLLGRRRADCIGKKTLVLDLDETLVHSSFKQIAKSDFIVPIELDNVIHNVYVLKRPYAEEFLIECAQWYEVVVFTASQPKYADPLLDLLDKKGVISARLFRDSCTLVGYSYVKDLENLGRKMQDILIVDNSPHSYRFQPLNAIPITSWFDDPNDTELKDLIPVLKTTLFDAPDVRAILDGNKSYQWLCNQAT